MKVWDPLRFLKRSILNIRLSSSVFRENGKNIIPYPWGQALRIVQSCPPYHQSHEALWAGLGGCPRAAVREGELPPLGVRTGGNTGSRCLFTAARHRSQRTQQARQRPAIGHGPRRWPHPTHRSASGRWCPENDLSLSPFRFFCCVNAQGRNTYSVVRSGMSRNHNWNG